MSKHKLTKEQKATKTKARWKILAAVKAHSALNGLTQVSWRMTHINWAVFVCRQNNLISPKVLEEGGFNAER